MTKVLPLVWYYLAHYKGKTFILAFCLTTALFLPLTMHWLVGMLEAEMVRRAEHTPLVIGPEGSRFDLVLHALYFRAEAGGTLPQAERFAVEESGHATTIPLFARYRARGYPVVGTTLEYFGFRELKIADGRPLTLLGDCVIGSEVARDLGLAPGDRLLTDPENVFDLGGAYPLNLRVAGILEPSHSPDDRAVFTDLRTTWILEGIGHGHQDLSGEENPELVLESGPDHVVASPAVVQFTTITAENLDSFHFHGDPADFPLTALIALPRDPRAGTLLLGRYVGGDSRYQALRPALVIEELLGMVVRLKRFFDLHHLFLLVVTAMFVFLVMLLSLRLRRREMDILFHLGCGRRTVFALQAIELVVLLTLSFLLAAGASRFAVEAARGWVQALTG